MASSCSSNPGFEDGDSGAWTWTTNLSNAKASPFRNNTTNPHSGGYYTYLGYWDGVDSGNYGTLDRPSTVPTGAGSVSLGYLDSTDHWPKTPECRPRYAHDADP